VGTGKATRGPQDCLIFMRMTIPGRRGENMEGGPPLNHWRKPARAMSNRACRERELNNTVLQTFLTHFHGRAKLDQGAQFFAYNLLIIEFKRKLMKFKNVALAIPVEQFIFTIFSTFHSKVISLQTLLGQQALCLGLKG